QENDWYVRHARRLLQERAAAGNLAASAVERLRRIAVEHSDETRRLRAAWALHAAESLDPATRDAMFADASPYVRGWALQLAFDRPPAERLALLSRLASLAQSDPSPVVRLAVASALAEVPAEQRWETAAALLSHAEDAADHNLPLLIWYAVEPLAEVDVDRALALVLAHDRAMPLVRDFMIRRIGAIDTAASRNAIIAAARQSDDPVQQRALLAELRSALRGRPRVAKPAAWDDMFAALAGSADGAVRWEAISLGVTFGDPHAEAALRALASDASADADQRRAAVEALLEARAGGLAELLGQLLGDPELRGLALTGLARFDAPTTPHAILRAYGALSRFEKQQALATLASRAPYALALLDAVEAGQVPRTDLSADLARQLLNLQDDAVAARLADVWGTMRSTPEDKAAQIAAYRQLVESTPADLADPILGRAVFQRTCQSCHTLYGVGNDIGPDLTGSNRADLDYLLSNIVDPSAVISREYQTTIVLTDGGRVFTGVLSAEDDHSVTLPSATETLTIPKDEIEQRSLSELSIMPDNQLQQFTDEEIVSLIAYLRGKEQAPMLAAADGAPPLFTGDSLDGWQGNLDVWSVDNREIVGMTAAGLPRNEFLVSNLAADDFELAFEVLLVDNAGNSGMQFRSRALPDGDVAGYQADIGEGWWGKLYEEHGREILWDASGEQHVKPGQWNSYRIRAAGSRVQTWINGQLCVDLDDPPGRRRGIFAMQVHSGGPTEVRFRNLQLRNLAPPSP
ncbi:MAG TPA: DUF1080 domain-containing protein, partial [Lacipirellulaceae bacterium]|nr:DUF1080 domain-containing protein [Lacipirellulaceae bacterium]